MDPLPQGLWTKFRRVGMVNPDSIFFLGNNGLVDGEFCKTGSAALEQQFRYAPPASYAVDVQARDVQTGVQ